MNYCSICNAIIKDGEKAYKRRRNHKTKRPICDVELTELDLEYGTHYFPDIIKCAECNWVDRINNLNRNSKGKLLKPLTPYPKH